MLNNLLSSTTMPIFKSICYYLTPQSWICFYITLNCDVMYKNEISGSSIWPTKKKLMVSLDFWFLAWPWTWFWFFNDKSKFNGILTVSFVFYVEIGPSNMSHDLITILIIVTLWPDLDLKVFLVCDLYSYNTLTMHMTTFCLSLSHQAL